MKNFVLLPGNFTRERERLAARRAEIRKRWIQILLAFAAGALFTALVG